MWSATCETVAGTSSSESHHSSIAARSASGSSACSARSALACASAWRFNAAPSGATNDGTNVTITTAARLADQLEHVVGDVAGDVAERAGGRVGEDHRRLAHLDRLSHRVVGDVAEVDQHAGAVQLADDLLAERREAAVRMLAGGRVRPVRVVVVGERHVAGAEARQDAQRAERVPDRVAALDPDHRRDPALGGDPPRRRIGRACLLQPAGVAMDQVRRTPSICSSVCVTA